MTKMTKTTETQKISSSTRLLAVIGDPVAHSLSPLIHNTLYAEQGIDALYLHAHVKKDQLDVFLKNMPVLNWMGFNATMPHKKALLSHVEHSGDHPCGVNTVRVNGDGTLSATSTDGEGFMDSLKYEGVKLHNKKIAIIGAGAVVHTIAEVMIGEKASSVTIVNRTEEKAALLAKQLSSSRRTEVKPARLSQETLTGICEESHIVINATPMGLEGYPSDFTDLSFMDALKKDSIVVDLNYKPRRSTFLRNAEKRGLNVINGLGMLVGQALRAHEFWFGVEPTNDMFKKILDLLEDANAAKTAQKSNVSAA